MELQAEGPQQKMQADPMVHWKMGVVNVEILPVLGVVVVVVVVVVVAAENSHTFLVHLNGRRSFYIIASKSAGCESRRYLSSRLSYLSSSSQIIRSLPT